ncbi:unnamed protein product [Mytilus edulis]|uniref:Uncharacterized protein n=1 Tax=Mytilus edulis TaxID=6550 RepID=A0A8S3VK32_MYTED|nr:unnamed protein product [Mytilus edulis]
MEVVSERQIQLGIPVTSCRLKICNTQLCNTCPCMASLLSTRCAQGRLLGFTNRRPRLRSDAVPTVFACNQDTREDSNLQTRKRVLNQIPVPLDNVAKEDKWNSALTECKENNIPKKKIRQGEKAEQENIGRPSKPLMVDVSVQTLTPSQLQTDLDIGTSMTNNSYLQMPVIPAQPLDTAFISSPKKDQDTSDASTPSPPPSPDKTDSDCSYVPSDESHDSNQSTSPDSNISPQSQRSLLSRAA